MKEHPRRGERIGHKKRQNDPKPRVSQHIPSRPKAFRTITFRRQLQAFDIGLMSLALAFQEDRQQRQAEQCKYSGRDPP